VSLTESHPMKSTHISLPEFLINDPLLADCTIVLAHGAGVPMDHLETEPGSVERDVFRPVDPVAAFGRSELDRWRLPRRRRGRRRHRHVVEVRDRAAKRDRLLLT